MSYLERKHFFICHYMPRIYTRYLQGFFNTSFQLLYHSVITTSLKGRENCVFLLKTKFELVIQWVWNRKFISCFKIHRASRKPSPLLLFYGLNVFLLNTVKKKDGFPCPASVYLTKVSLTCKIFSNSVTDAVMSSRLEMR